MEYITFDLGRVTREIIERENGPKFIYLSFNAPHGPLDAPQDLIDEMQKRHPGVTESRALYLASVKAWFQYKKKYKDKNRS